MPSRPYARWTRTQESIHYLYLVSDNDVLTGVLSLRTLVIAKPEMSLDELSTKELITVHPDLDQEECAQTIAKYDLLAIPVVDEQGVMLGVVTVDDAMDVLEEEHEEDLQQRSISSPWGHRHHRRAAHRYRRAYLHAQ